MMAATIAAKYPDLFCGAGGTQSPTSLDAWYYELKPGGKRIYAEMGTSPGQPLLVINELRRHPMARNFAMSQPSFTD
jgi:hypothetical protein